MTVASVSPDGESVRPSATPGAGIAACDAAEGLAAIAEPDMALVIWRRALPSCLQTWLDRMDASCLPHLRVLVRPGDLRRAVEPHLDEIGMPPGDMRDLLVGDVDDLVSAFAGIARSDLVDVRLERVSHDSCWKFHRDYVEARLLTTYRGPGTEWVQPIHAERALRAQKRFKGPLEHGPWQRRGDIQGKRRRTGQRNRAPLATHRGHWLHAIAARPQQAIGRISGAVAGRRRTRDAAGNRVHGYRIAVVDRVIGLPMVCAVRASPGAARIPVQAGVGGTV